MDNRTQLAHALRFLAIDAVEKANSGHPGMPMGMADVAEVLWNDFLKHHPLEPHWINRDRFVLSNGHGSMLLYALLHLTGYALTIDDLQKFRQLHSKTPGHPEYGITPGVDTTTGPLGQGLANAVGMALAERLLANTFNRPGFSLIDHFTYVFAGDGDLMEGISHEASSLAGTLKLNKLIVFWDNNGISIDGKLDNWFGEDVSARFKSYGWHVWHVDGHDSAQIIRAIESARGCSDKPSLICCKTTIGFGSPNLAGTAKTHGAPLGAAEIAATRSALNWEYPPFVIPEQIRKKYDAKARGTEHYNAWLETLDRYLQAHPELGHEFQRRIASRLPQDWHNTANKLVSHMRAQTKPMATRKSSGECIALLARHLPELLGGSADLTESNNTHWPTAEIIKPEKLTGNYLHYGVREFGMVAMMNGMALHTGLIPFGGTFLTFLDYAKNAVRMAALMQLPVTLVFTHDSIGLGEDGPTHQPIEHLTMLRATPNVSVWRPADAVETAVAWISAIEHKTGPTCLVLSRQNLPLAVPANISRDQIARGGYILQDGAGSPHVILIATGSEVSLALAAASHFNERSMNVRVVSMPSVDKFLSQSTEYQNEVLPSHIEARIAIEAGATLGWYRLVGLKGRVMGIDRFGESAPASAVYDTVGLTLEKIKQAIGQYF